jgi:hypothetical protein
MQPYPSLSLSEAERAASPASVWRAINAAEKAITPSAAYADASATTLEHFTS